jgi:hypothetical protein
MTNCAHNKSAESILNALWSYEATALEIWNRKVSKSSKAGSQFHPTQPPNR